MVLVITRGPQPLCIQGSGALCPEVGRMLLTKQFEREPVIGQAKVSTISQPVRVSQPTSPLNMQLRPDAFHGPFSSF